MMRSNGSALEEASRDNWLLRRCSKFGFWPPWATFWVAKTYLFWIGGHGPFGMVSVRQDLRRRYPVSSRARGEAE